jgi:hypothetical protein
VRYHSGSELGKSDLQSREYCSTDSRTSISRSVAASPSTTNSSVLHPSAVRDHTPTSIELSKSLSPLSQYPPFPYSEFSPATFGTLLSHADRLSGITLLYPLIHRVSLFPGPSSPSRSSLAYLPHEARKFSRYPKAIKIPADPHIPRLVSGGTSPDCRSTIEPRSEPDSIVQRLSASSRY